MFFELTRLYSYNVSGAGPLAVPIFTDPQTPFDTPPRASLDEAYDRSLLIWKKQKLIYLPYGLHLKEEG